MRVIGAGLSVFLVVTAILLYQVSSGSEETAARANVAFPEPAATLTPTPALPTQQPTHTAPTATATVPAPTATATTAPVAPTLASTQPPLASHDTTADEADVVEPEQQESWVAEPTVEQVPTEDATDGASLAALGEHDAWSSAIETPNGGLIGVVLPGLVNIRAQPTVDAEAVGELHAGWPVAIYGVMTGEPAGGTDLWYQVSGGYISSALIGPFVPAEPAGAYDGHWVDVDLTSNIAVAYIGEIPVNAVTIISGKPGFETPVGEHTIFSRVESETLDSTTVGIPEGDPEYYYLPNVPYTQYFATGGFAIHANYWSDPWQFGTALSHGCVNMLEDDAAWFWWFLDIGSVVNVHY